MKKIAETLGMEEPDLSASFDIGDNTIVYTEENEDDESKELSTVDEIPIPVIDDKYEDKLIKTGYDQIEQIVTHAMSNGLQIAELARDADPRYKARLLEVSNMFMKTALDSVKQKQDQATRAKEHKFKRATTGMPNQVSNTQVNNYYGTREEIMEQIRNGKIKKVDTENGENNE